MGCWFLASSEGNIMANKKNFIPLNRKRIESSDTISFGAYKDEDGEWKSTGQNGNFRIEANFTANQLQFNASSISEVSEIIPFVPSFYIDNNGYLVSRNGFLTPKITIGTEGVQTGFSVEKQHNEHNLFAQYYTEFYFGEPSNSEIPIGAKFYITKGNTNEEVYIVPLVGVRMFGRVGYQENLPLKWTNDSSYKPVVHKYSTVVVQKVGETKYIIAGLLERKVL